MPTEKLNGYQVAKIIETYDNSQYVTNEAYYQGSNPTILSKSYSGDPDNRVPLPFGRRTVLDIMGYAFKPGNVNYIFDTIEENNEAEIEKIKEVFEDNRENMVSAEIFQDALIKGEGAELVYWEGGESLPQFVQIPREQCIFIYEDTVKRTLKYSIRYYTSTVINSDGKADEIKHADVYYPDTIEFFERKKTATNETVDPQIDTQTNTTEKTGAYTLVTEEPHFFGAVPLYPYRLNADRLGVFQPSIKMIDAMDDMTSDSILNALERFNDHYLALSKKLTATDVENIKETHVFDDLGGREEGNFVEFINRVMDINSTLEGFKTYERLYYELTGIPNLSDEKFHSQSGIAILYALIPFENLVTTFEVYFNIGMQYRLNLLNTVLGTNLKAEIEWNRNLPVDIMSRINEIVTLKREGLISTETALNRLPDQLIGDAEIEVEKIKAEKEENMALFETSMSEPTEEEDETDENTEVVEEDETRQ